MKIAKSLQQIQPSYIREILAAAQTQGVISLAGGLPDGESFPLDLMENSLNKLAASPQLFQYGHTAGYAPLLDYFKQTGQQPDHHSAIVCTGSQQGLDLIARAFLNPNDTVVMEAPSYLGALQVFGLAQANVQSIQQRADGPDLNQLEAKFSTGEVVMFYAVPDFHNPTGVCWSLEVRQKVAQLCIQYNVTLIEDVPYRELRFNGQALPLASSFCPDNSLVLRSFSKIATPGIRLGLLTGKTDWINPLIKVKQSSDLHSSVPMQAVLLDLLKHENFDKHLAKLRDLYQKRYLALTEQLSQKLPAGCQFNTVDGGMFIWLTVPDCNTYQLAQAAIDNNVAVVPSAVFYQQGETVEPALRLNFTNASETELAIAVDRLVTALNEGCKPA